MLFKKKIAVQYYWLQFTKYSTLFEVVQSWVILVSHFAGVKCENFSVSNYFFKFINST